MYTDLTLERNGETQTVELTDNTHLFHRDLTNLFLEQYVDSHGVPYTYDDITHIHTSYYTHNRIDVLPARLTELCITKTNLSIFPVLPVSIEYVDIRQSRLYEFPDMTDYIHLKNLHISECMITRAFVRPKLHEDTRATICSYNGSKPFIYYSDLHEKPSAQPAGTTGASAPQGGLTYDPTVPADDERVDNTPYEGMDLDGTDLTPNLPDSRKRKTVRGEVEYQRIYTHRIGQYEERAVPVIRHRFDRDAIRRPNITPLNGAQTVHLHSINQSVLQSYEKLEAYARKHDLTRIEDPLFELFHAVEPAAAGPTGPDAVHEQIENAHDVRDAPPAAAGRTWKQYWRTLWNCFPKRINPYQLIFGETQVEFSMRSWCNLREQHTALGASFSDLLELVVRVAKHHPQRADIYERIKIEMADALGMCFTGRMNRLMNALVGFDDLDVQVGLSVREQVTMEIQSLVKRVTQHPDQFDKIVEELKTLLEQQSIREFPQDLRKSYLDAMEDYRP